MTKKRALQRRSVPSSDTDQFFDYEVMLGGVKLSRDTPSTTIDTNTIRKCSQTEIGRVFSVCDDDDMKTTVTTACNSITNTPHSKANTQDHPGVKKSQFHLLDTFNDNYSSSDETEESCSDDADN